MQEGKSKSQNDESIRLYAAALTKQFPRALGVLLWLEGMNYVEFCNEWMIDLYWRRWVIDRIRELQKRPVFVAKCEKLISEGKKKPPRHVLNVFQETFGG